MIQSQLKLKLNSKQKTLLTDWLWNLTSVWNWAIRKIELNAKNKIYYSPKEFQNLLSGHSDKLDIPSHTLQGVLLQAHNAWDRCFKKISKQPKLKSNRNKLNSIPFVDPIKPPAAKVNKIGLPGLGKVRFHKQHIPEGQIKCGRIVRRSSGWYLCLFIATDREPIKRIAHGKIGIDPGFKNLLTLSNGEIIKHPRELEALEHRIAQAQRGRDKQLVSRLQERRANRVKDRNHKLSLRLIRENVVIRFSADNHKAIAKRFGKSVSSSAHYQLRQMLKYKSRAGGTEYDEPVSKFSTMTCSICGSLSGPTGLSGLVVRQWRCTECGTLHDRDSNAARNALFAGVGTTHEETHKCVSLSGIPAL